MLSQFLSFINKHQLIAPTDRILLTVSGGVDSMVMLHLFMQTDFHFAIAHCNFQLRGQDSIDDEQFVSQFAQEHNIQLFSQTFDTQNYAILKGISIEMAARELRYNWFQQILQKHNYTLIATAHHQNDVLETFFLNMLRTTGLSGLRSIKAKQGNIIRPMLFCGKNEILQYAEKNHLQHQEDITNQDDKILRNYIRLHIIPEFEHLKPNAKKQMLNTIHILGQQENIYKSHIQTIAKNIIKTDNQYKSINISDIEQLEFATTYLYEILTDYGMNYTQVQQMLQHLHSTEEKYFETPDYQIIKTRNHIQIRQHLVENKKIITIQEINDNPCTIGGLYFEILDYSNLQEIYLKTDKSTIYCDFEKIIFPLALRTWQHGDYFYPINGIGRKKISDFYTNNKLSSFEKSHTQLLCNANNEIIWVVNMRADNRFKVSKNTNKILKIKLL